MDWLVSMNGTVFKAEVSVRQILVVGDAEVTKNVPSTKDIK